MSVHPLSCKWCTYLAFSIDMNNISFSQFCQDWTRLCVNVLKSTTRNILSIKLRFLFSTDIVKKRNSYLISVVYNYFMNLSKNGTRAKRQIMM